MLGLADKNAVLVLVGDGKERPPIEERIRRFNLEGGLSSFPKYPMSKSIMPYLICSLCRPGLRGCLLSPWKRSDGHTLPSRTK